MSVTERTIPSSYGDIKLFTITNNSGASVVLSSLGAGIVEINVPDKQGEMANVVLGYKDPAAYMGDGPCMGKIPGRFANRIAKGRFSLAGKEYQLCVNNGPNALHGGPTGFMNRIWEAEPTGNHAVTFKYTAADGEEGYPGNLTVTATYRWSESNALTLRLSAETDAPTIVNLTNHAYFNLDGEGSGSILGHELLIFASRYLDIDDTQIPNGKIKAVEGTPFDFQQPKAIGDDINADKHSLKVCKGYDHCYKLDNYVKGVMRDVAILRGNKSGRMLTIATTQPGMQVYTGNWLDGCPESISGGKYTDYDGVALECQNYPDAPNHPDFPDCRLNPGEKYEEIIQFRFH